MVISMKGLKYVLLVLYQIGNIVVILGKIHWEEYLVQIINLESGRDRL